MATFTTSCIFTELVPNPGYKEIIIETDATFDSASDRVELTLRDYGIDATGAITVNGYEMSATHGIVVTEAPTTGVYSGVMQISGNTSKTYPAKKIYRVVGKIV